MIETRAPDGLKNEPLVSVVVFTYNSEKYVIETLESVKAQTYQNIELVISDDCSSDETCILCNKWIDKNGSFFNGIKLITYPRNTGIVFNLNRGLKAASGEWIKIIAGDDLLLEQSIHKYVQFVSSNVCNVVAAKRYYFYNNDPDQRRSKDDHNIFNQKGISNKEQYQIALRGFGAPHNTWFFRKKFIEAIGYYDEKFPMMEDWSMKIRVLNSGEKIYFCDQYTLLYRVHQDSVSLLKEGKIYSGWYMNAMKPVKEQLILPYLPWDERLMMKYDFWIAQIFYGSILNKYNLFNRTIKYLLRVPVEIGKHYFTKRLMKSVSDRISKSKLTDNF